MPRNANQDKWVLHPISPICSREVPVPAMPIKIIGYKYPVIKPICPREFIVPRNSKYHISVMTSYFSR